MTQAGDGNDPRTKEPRASGEDTAWAVPRGQDSRRKLQVKSPRVGVTRTQAEQHLADFAE